MSRFIRNFSLGLSVLFALIFFFYGYALYFGAYLKVEGVEIRPGEAYSGGTIFSVISCIIISSFSLGGAS